MRILCLVICDMRNQNDFCSIGAPEAPLRFLNGLNLSRFSLSVPCSPDSQVVARARQHGVQLQRADIKAFREKSYADERS